MQYPEHDKLKALNGANQTVGYFLDWLSDEGVTLAKWGEDDKLYPAHLRQTQLIAQFFEIDEAKLEAEKRQMLTK